MYFNSMNSNSYYPVYQNYNQFYSGPSTGFTPVPTTSTPVVIPTFVAPRGTVEPRESDGSRKRKVYQITSPIPSQSDSTSTTIFCPTPIRATSISSQSDSRPPSVLSPTPTPIRAVSISSQSDSTPASVLSSPLIQAMNDLVKGILLKDIHYRIEDFISHLQQPFSLPIANRSDCEEITQIIDANRLPRRIWDSHIARNILKKRILFSEGTVLVYRESFGVAVNIEFTRIPRKEPVIGQLACTTGNIEGAQRLLSLFIQHYGNNNIWALAQHNSQIAIAVYESCQFTLVSDNPSSSTYRYIYRRQSQLES